MKLSEVNGVSSAGEIVVGATAFFADTGTLLVRRLRKVGGGDNTFGRVGNI